MSKITGLWVPLVTPMYRGEFDMASMAKLIDSVDEYADGYVPCLSSGEGQFLSNEQWHEVVMSVRNKTKKLVVPGIKRENIGEIVSLEHIATELKCDGVAIPVPYKEWEQNKKYFEQLLQATTLPIVIYNTETAFISDVANLKELDRSGRIVAIKDSSMDRKFFAAICSAKVSGELSMSVLQGMEHHLDVPQGCDGYLVSLLNVEPGLVEEMYKNSSAENNKKILDIFWKYNLGGNWFVTLKALLFERGIIRSAEEVALAIKL